MTEPMTQAELDAVKARVENYAKNNPDYVLPEKASLGFNIARICKQLKDDWYDDAFSELASHSIADVPNLLTHIDRLTAALATKTAECDQNYRNYCRVNAENEMLHENYNNLERFLRGPKHIADALIPVGAGTLPEVLG